MITTAHLHPMTVHFPIAIIMVGFVFDFIYVFFRKDHCLSLMGHYLGVIGMAAAILAWGTGYFFTNPLAGEAEVVRSNHQLFATLTLVTIILTTLFRLVLDYLKKEGSWLKYVVILMYFMAFLFVSYTGYLGGKLVIEYLIGF
jgi:uncharacterized membrane protein